MKGIKIYKDEFFRVGRVNFLTTNRKIQNFEKFGTKKKTIKTALG
jgi:hypothetical protein